MRALRRLGQRLPVSLRHHWKLVATCVAFLAVLGLVFGNTRVRPLVISDIAEAVAAREDIAGTVDLFDLTVSHTIAVSYDEQEYQQLLEAYFDDGEKEWMDADIVIDGTLVEDVGIRLKGNSTLRGLTKAGSATSGGQAPAADGQGQPADGGQNQAPAGGQGGPAGGRGPGMGSLSTDEPAKLPWLVDFDKYVDGRSFQGHDQLAIRPTGTGASSLLSEALALELVARSGEVSQAYTFVSFSVNGTAGTVRLVIEHPDEGYADSLGDGVLYKALSTSNFTYQGEDPTDYTDDFKQINKEGSQDLQPVINLLKWLDGASDERFAAELDDWVEVDSFANYVAVQNLLLNFDDMAGPGKNFYLWYDLTTKKIKVISWDLNFAFSSSTDTGPHDAVSMGGGRMGGGPQDGQGQQMQPPGDGQMRPPDGGFGGAPAAGGGPGGGMRMGNELKERFLAAEAFTGTYDEAYRELYQKLYASGAATQVLDRLAAALGRVDGLAAAAVTQQVENLRSTITARARSLADDEVITAS